MGGYPGNGGGRGGTDPSGTPWYTSGSLKSPKNHQKSVKIMKFIEKIMKFVKKIDQTRTHGHTRGHTGTHAVTRSHTGTRVIDQ